MAKGDQGSGVGGALQGIADAPSNNLYGGGVGGGAGIQGGVGPSQGWQGFTQQLLPMLMRLQQGQQQQPLQSTPYDQSILNPSLNRVRPISSTGLPSANTTGNLRRGM